MEMKKLFKKIQGRKPAILGMDQFLKYSILLPLIERNGEIHVLFEVRSLNLRRQPGEICFPGGKIDAGDRNEMHSAIRETSEELGIAEDEVQDVFPLDYMVSPFGTIIYPHVGKIINPDKINPNPSEVAEVFTVPLSYLQHTEPDRYKINFEVQPEENFPYELIIGGENYDWRTRQMEEYFYEYEGKVIWGMTAKVLEHFLEIIKENDVEN